jgi:hypothetical protein
LLWAYRLVGSGDVRIRDVVIDPMSQVGVVGSFEGSADLDPGDGVFQVESKGGHDIFLLRLLADGNLQWGWAGGADDNDIGYAIATDELSRLYITGEFEGTIRFQSGESPTYEQTSVGGTDIFFLRFNNGGTLAWARTMGGPEDDAGSDIAVDARRNVYVVGTFADEADLDPLWTATEIRSHGRDDIFLTMVPEVGNFSWQTYFGGAGDEGNARLLVEPDGSLYVAGEFSQSANFNVRGDNGRLDSRGLNDIFVVRLAANRDFQWAFNLGSTQNDRLAGIAQDGFKSLYVLGAFGDTLDLEPGSGETLLVSSGAADIFLAKYTQQGQLLRGQNMVNTQEDRARDLAVDSSGNVIIGGEYSGSIEFAPDFSLSTGQPDGAYSAFVTHFARDTWTPLPSRAYLPGIIAGTPAQ